MDNIDRREEDEQEEQNRQDHRIKIVNPLKSIIADDTIVESAQDVIDRDTDVERKNAFKKAYEILLAIFPETSKKKKSKKEREKEEFDRSIQYQQRELARQQEKQEKQEEIEEEKDKGIERGE